MQKTNALAVGVALVLFGLFQNALCLTLNIWHGPGGGLWNNAANWSTSQVPGQSDSVVFDNTGQSCTLDTAATVGSITFTSAWTFSIDFNGKKLRVVNHGDFATLNSPGVFGTDTIEFIGTGNQEFKPPSDHTIVLPILFQSGSGTTTVLANGFKTGKFAIVNGTFTLGNTSPDSAGSISISGGTMNFGSSSLKVGGSSVDFSAIGSIIPGSGKLEFSNAVTQAFIPKAGVTFPEIVQNNTYSMATNLTGVLDAAGITVMNGTFNLNSTHTGCNIGFIRGTGGSLNFNGDSINVSDSVNLLNVGTQMSGNGIMKLVNNSAASYVPPNFWPNPTLIKAGLGQTTVRLNNIKGPKLRIESGLFSLGTFVTGVNDSLDTVETSGGGLDFGNCTLSVRYSNVDLSPLVALTPQTGALKFTSTSLQSFWPSMSYTNPIIKHAGTGTLKLMNTLGANGFEQPSGASTFNLNGYDISIVNNGNFIVNSCTFPSELSGLSGRTISVAGNVYITGIPPSQTVDMGAGSSWSLNAGGQVRFDCVNFSNCDAIGSPGVASSSPNNGGNVNWTFVKQWVGGGTHDWTDPPNWSPTGKPTKEDSVVFSAAWNCAANGIDDTVKAITFSGFAASFSFGNDTMVVLTHADFSGANNVDSGSGAIKFIGSGMATLKGPGFPGCLPTIFNEGTGTTTALNSVKAKNLFVSNGTFLFGGVPGHDTLVHGIAINGGTVNLGSNNSIETQTLSGTGILQSGFDTLVVSGNADFSGLSAFYPATGTVVINTQNTRLGTLIPGFVTFNNLILWNNGDNNLGTTDSILVGGSFFTVNGDLVLMSNKPMPAKTNEARWRFDSSNPSVTVNGNVVVTENPGSGPVNNHLFLGTGTWTFKKNVALPIGSGSGKNATLIFSGTTTQACTTWIASPTDSLGYVQHTSDDTLRLKSALRCKSFDQTAGTLDLSGASLSVAGNFSASGSTSGTFAPLGGSVLTIGGNANISGSPTSFANLVGGSSYSIYMTAGHSLTADWAKIGDCYVYMATGYATNSRKMNSSGGGWIVSGMNLVWMGSANSSWKNPANWSPALLPSDSDNVFFDAAGVGHNCQLDSSVGIKNITFAGGYTGTFDFSTFTLTVSGNADFSQIYSLANTSGTLRFYSFGPSLQYFTPKAGVPFPKINMDGPGGSSNVVEVIGNPLTASGFVMNYGTWNWGNGGAIHTVASLRSTMPSAIMDFGNSTVRVMDSVYLGCNITYSSGGIIDLVKGPGTQCIYGWDTLPEVRHAHQGTVKLIQGNLKCESYEQDSGSIVLNGYNMSTNGDMLFNSGSATISDLPGHKLTARGRLDLNGIAGDSIIVNGGVPKCTLSVSGQLDANYAVLSNCVAWGLGGYAGHSRDAGNNTNWTFISNGIKKWAAGAGNTSWSLASNWMPSGVPTAMDSVVFDATSSQMCMLDANGIARALTFASGFTGTFDFYGNTLNLYGSADFSGPGNVMGYNGTLSFNGNSQSVLMPPASGSMPSIVRATGSGTLTIVNSPINAVEAGISVLSGTLNLGTGLAHSVKTVSGSAGANLIFGSNSSLTVSGDATLAPLTVTAQPGDSLIFNGYFGQRFSFPSALANLTIVVQKNDTLKLSPSNFQCDQLVMYSGTLNLGSGLSHSVNAIHVYGGVLDFNGSALTVNGVADFSGAQDIVPGTGTLMFAAAAGGHTLVPQSPDTMPAIVHAGMMNLEIANNPLVCKSFTENCGLLTLVESSITTIGDFTVTNGQSISGLDNRTIAVGGNASIAGKTGSLLNLNPSLPWFLSVAGNCLITNATIGKCSAAGCAHWPSLANCFDGGGNTKFDFAPPGAAITTPANGAFLTSLSSISGTAADAGSGVSNVMVSVKRLVDLLYWNGTLWTAQPKMLPATGTTAWSFQATGISMSDGGYAIQAQATDSAANRGSIVNDSFFIKTTVPSAPGMSIVNNNGFTNLAAIQLALSVVGADSMRFQLNAAGWTAWEGFAGSKSFSIVAGGEGMKKIYAIYKDKAGNATGIVSDSVVYDFTPPQSPSITIIDNNGYTGSPTPQLALSATGADSMRFMVNGVAWSTWEPYATVKNTLDISLGGNGSKVVAVTYKDKAGNICVMTHDSTVYDSRLPAVTAVTILDSNGYINTARPRVQIAAVNADSMRIALSTDTAAAAWKLFSSLDSVTVANGSEGLKRVFVQVKTTANARSVWISDSTVYDATPPQSPSIVIVDNNGYTSSPTPSITLSAVAADSMQFMVNTQAWTLWEAYGVLKSNLSANSGGDGKKIISVRFKDKAGNFSTTVSDSTILDSRVPSVTTVAVLDSNGFYNSKNLLVRISAVNADSMRVALTVDSALAPWKSYATIDTVDVGACRQCFLYVCAQVKTVAGTRSAWVADSTTGDTAQPKATLVTKGSFTPQNWPGVISGTMADAGSGVRTVFLSIMAMSDTSFWNGTTWTKLFFQHGINGISNWSFPLPNLKTGTYQVACHAIDNAGNRQMVPDSGIISIVRDTIAPLNHYTVAVASIGDTAIRVSWTVDPVQGDAASMMFGCAKFALTPLTTPYPYRDTSFVFGNAGSPGLWRVMTYLMDSSGNTSPARFDTITIKPQNTLPVLSSWILQDTVAADSMATGLLVVSDPDAGDSISVSWSVKPSWVTPAAQARPAGVYAFTMSGRPAQSDTGWNHLTFAVSDRSGPAFTLYDSIFVKAGPKVPVVVIHRDQTKLLNAAARFVLGTQNAGDSAVTFNVTLRALDDTSFIKHVSSMNGTVDLYPLSDGRYELTAIAVSATGIRDTIGARDTFTIKGASTHQFAGQADTTVASWQMVSFPSRTFPGTTLAMLNNLLHWDEQYGERDFYGYYRRASELGQINPGMGYWRRVTDTSTVVIPRTNMLDSAVTMTLYKGAIGWNQIASPFPYPVAWPYPGTLWLWNDSTHDFQEANGVLNPWQGYWVMTDSTMTIRIENKPIFTVPAAAKRNVAAFSDKANWQVRVNLSTGTNSDAQNVLGFNAGARNGYDACDAAKPPRMSDYQYLFFSHPEWKRGCTEYARDIRRTLSGVEAFTIGITPGKGKQPAMISCDGLSQVSDSVGFYLADEKGIQTVEAGKSYPVAASSKVVYKTLFVTTDKNFLKNYPRAFALGLPYPNPTRRMAHIQYSLPYHLAQAGVIATDPYKVSIALYDIMGRQVRQLVYSMKDPGNYSLPWDGKNNAGLYVAAGMYFCRLDAGQFNSVKKITVVR